MKPIRVLYFLNSLVRGGVEEHVLSLIAGLDRRSFVPALACPPALLAEMDGDLQTFDVATYPVEAFAPTDPRQLLRLAQVFRRARPDVVHPHLFRATLVAAPIARATRVPAVVETYHGREAWRRGRIKGSFFLDRVVVSCWVDRVIAVSEAAGRFLVEGKRIAPAKITVIPNGRDLREFTPEPHARMRLRDALGLGDKEPLIGVVARLEEQKGHRFFLDALPKVLAEFPEARVVLVGDGSLRPGLEAQAHQLGIQHAVTFAGFRRDVPRCLDAMDLVVLPSLFEGMPLTAIEAMAMGKPVVATAVDGTPEVVRDGVTGVLVEPADPDALAVAVLDVLRCPDLGRRLGEQGRRLAHERFDVRQQVAATEAVYRALVRV